MRRHSHPSRLPLYLSVLVSLISLLLFLLSEPELDVHWRGEGALQPEPPRAPIQLSVPERLHAFLQDDDIAYGQAIDELRMPPPLRATLSRGDVNANLPIRRPLTLSPPHRALD
jgi:hypothetical protein